MQTHFAADYQCVKCGAYFLPFIGPVTICPDCGEMNFQPDDFATVVKDIVAANKIHFNQFGRFTPPAYGVFSLVDHYIYYTANVFDLYLSEQSPIELIIETVIKDEAPEWREHLKDLLLALFSEARQQKLL
jgi:hypothetical protein